MNTRKRNTPCTECRQLRRKCTFPDNSKECLRCIKTNKICTIGAILDSEQTVDDEIEIEHMKQTIKELEWTVLRLEDEMNSLSSNSSHESTPTTATTIKSVTRMKNSNETHKLFESMIKSSMFTWKVGIKNGVFQIETGIRSINDLLSFHVDKETVQYLSPLGSMSTTYNNDPETYRGESEIVVKFGPQLDRGSKLLPFTFKLLTLCAKHNVPTPEALSLPYDLLMNPLDMMDRFIRTYFTCHNSISPMIHEKVFMLKYNKLSDPFTDPLALSLCCYVCSSPCDHLDSYTIRERRNMSDYFFLKAKNIILDQFDEPDKRLENIMCINALTKYMQVTFKLKECRKLVAIAYQICSDLRDKYPVPVFDSFSRNVSVGDACGKFGSDTYNKYLDYVLYSRHVAITLSTRRLMDYYSNITIDESALYFPRWLYLDDEPEQTKRFVQCQNWVLGMFNHPFVGKIMNQILRLHTGLESKLTFESIVRLEDVINEWFNCIPIKFRISADFRSEAMCKAAVDETSDCILLMTFLHFHLFLVNIYSSLAQPIALNEHNDLLLPIVQQTCLHHTLKGCRLLLHTVYRIFALKGPSQCQYSVGACDFLFRIIDIMLLLSLSPNPFISSEATKVLRDCMNDLDQVDFVKQYRVPIESSPIHLGLVNIDHPTSFHLEYYNQYPQPWFAMVYDASHFIAFSKK